MNTCRYCGEIGQVKYGARHWICYDCIKSRWDKQTVIDRLRPWQIFNVVPYRILMAIGFEDSELRAIGTRV